MDPALVPDRAAARPAPRRARRFPWRPYLYLLPAVLTVGVWVYWPLLGTLRLSLYEWNLLPTTPPVYVGAENYRQLLGLPEFGRALWNTLLYTLGVLPLAVLLPLAVALATQGLAGRARDVYRALVFVPMVMAPVVVAVVWRWLLHPTHGLVNHALAALGTEPLNFLRDERLALWTIVFITGWKLLGFSTLLFAAAITNVDRSLVEAARLDGATEAQVARRVVLPLISPTVLFVTLLTVLLSAQWTFASINVLTQGGPLHATTNIYHLLWEYGFSNFSVGWSAAAAALLLVGYGLIAALGLRLTRRYAVYDT